MDYFIIHTSCRWTFVRLAEHIPLDTQCMLGYDMHMCPIFNRLSAVCQNFYVFFSRTPLLLIGENIGKKTLVVVGDAFVFLSPYSQSNITINILHRSTDNKTRRIKIVCGSDFYCVKVAERFSPIFFCSIWIWKIGIIVHFRREMAFLRLVNNHNTHTLISAQYGNI